MATAKIIQGMLPGVDRPALASAFPTRNGSSAVMLDVGANVDCSPRMLAQFAVMGEAYYRVIFHKSSPRVGLLSIGEEDHKGNALTLEAQQLLKELKDIDFIGNVEGRDVYGGSVDVIVCDGFVGNVALKVSEGLVEAVGAMREMNPMLGLRGCRLGLLFPEINVMQTRAILEAAAELAKEGKKLQPKIMIPLVGHVNELKEVRRQLEAVAKEITSEAGTAVEYKFGTMIELPRAALTADQIAPVADFFSFGTNDLTQTTFGISRDDAEGKFLLKYVDGLAEPGLEGKVKILSVNPFQTLDRDGVGQLVRMAVENGRKANPHLELGICGEHGGDPDSIEFFHMVGLDYVSCSPFRVPVARLAAAQAALTTSERDK